MKFLRFYRLYRSYGYGPADAYLAARRKCRYA